MNTMSTPQYIRTQNRINHHTNLLNARTAKMASYAPDSKAYARAVEANEGDSALLVELKALAEKQAAKLEAAANAPAKVPGRRGRPQGSKETGTRFEIMVGEDEPSNDNVQELEVSRGLDLVGYRSVANG
jgi:hypothetical protein